MTERATCWSITENNPSDDFFKVELPAKWKLTGQVEEGKEGTVHYQGMLTTPQVRFSQVKKLFPTAHIEQARNKVALSRYVKKDETRVSAVADIVSNIPTLFDFQHTIAYEWDDIEFAIFTEKYDSATDAELKKVGMDEIALNYVDTLVAKHIENGECGIEYIAINPMWRSAWKKFWKSMVARERNLKIKSTVEVYQDGLDEEASSKEACSEIQETCHPAQE